MQENFTLLLKSNEMMQGLLKRQSIQEVLRKQSDYFLSRSGAELIVVFVKRREGDYAEFVFEKRKTLLGLMRRYNLNLDCGAVAEALSNAMGSAAQKPYKRVKALCPLLKGVIADRNCRNFVDRAALEEVLLFPIHLQNGRQIGLISYYYTTQTASVDTAELEQLSATLENIISLLYDEETGALFSRYVQVDDMMPKLTPKERKIVNRVLEGESYPSVAEAMGVSINTLKTHMKNIFAKYGVCSKLELQRKIINK